MSYEHTESNSASGPTGIRHHEIEELAHQLWLERGRPEGSPEEDWYRAELEIALQLAAISNRETVLAEAELETAA